MNATALLKQLDEQKLRERLDAIEAEKKALVVLLRSARAKARAEQARLKKEGRRDA